MDRKDDDRRDVREELESVRRQLAEATTTLGNLHLRLTQLEERVSEDSDTSQSESSNGNLELVSSIRVECQALFLTIWDYRLSGL